jgi:hypothetical protein
MNFFVNVLIGIIIFAGIGLLTIGNKLGTVLIVISIFLTLFTLYKRNLIKR